VKIDLKPVRICPPETDGEESVAGEVLAAQLAQLIQPFLHAASSRQLFKAVAATHTFRSKASFLNSVYKA